MEGRIEIPFVVTLCKHVKSLIFFLSQLPKNVRRYNIHNRNENNKTEETTALE